MSDPLRQFDFEPLRGRLRGARGRAYWRSLDELAETPAFQEMLHREFPEQASEFTDPVGRREFLKLMAASLALGGLTACGIAPPEEKILPYVRAPEEIIPGQPLFYATAMTRGGFGVGLLAESHMGRPIKIEGNERHPASLGATDVFAQASVLTLYDPDRSQTVTFAGRISTWSAFLDAAARELRVQRGQLGAGLRILTETVTSPTLATQIQQLRRQFPRARWHQYEPVNRDNVLAGSREAFGEDVNPIYRLEPADIILSLDADFLCSGPAGLRYAREFADRRRVNGTQAGMNRLYAVESTPSNTGSMADHRLPLRAADVEGFAGAVAERFGIRTGARGSSEAYQKHTQWIDALVDDLERHRGASLIIAGETQPPSVHALAHALNHALGNAGRTVVYTDPVEANPVKQTESLRELVEEMQAGRVEFLLILSGNPVFTAPADLDFAGGLEKVRFRAHLSLYEDETSELCHWHLPEAHTLETWSDTRAFDGTASIIQPLIAPLYGGKSAHEVISALLGQPGRSGYDIVREYWQNRTGTGNFEEVWQRALHDGVLPGTALAPRQFSLRAELRPGSRAATGERAASEAERGLEIVFRPDPTIHDGRFANNGWLQELPKPLTKLTWDNAALFSPASAERLGLENGDVVELHYRGRTVEGPVWKLPGQPDDSVTVHFGYGRTRAGRVGTGAGFDAYGLRTSDAPWFGAGLQVQKTGRRYPLASTQEHHSMEGRHLVRVGDLEEYRADPRFAQKLAHEPARDESLYPSFRYEGYSWGMTIDLNACTGCNACVIACQAENNIPIVGKDQVGRGREMHWLRVDRYYGGEPENPETYHQPVPCMHCENAPCELVCPVAATVHSSEGLNEMIYNRCVGTRYCSNNCPYKVRRFNFFQYADTRTPSLRLLHNPDVTVRSRGVMEKCTYCVQRINAARIEAEKEGRQIRDGEVVTACQAACPTQAIVFGDINDPNSRVAQLKASPRNYGLLAELNTRPRTTYLARLRNPNPELETR